LNRDRQFGLYLKSGWASFANRQQLEQLVFNTEQRPPSGVHKRRVGLVVVVSSEFQNRVEVGRSRTWRTPGTSIAPSVGAGISVNCVAGTECLAVTEEP
jgi:hypothetical protein